MTQVNLIAAGTTGLAGATASPQALTIPASTGPNKRCALWFYVAEGTAAGPVVLSSVDYDAGGTPQAMVFVARSNIDNGVGKRETVECWRLMESQMSAGLEAGKTFGWTIASGAASSARQAVFVYDGVDQTTPVAASATATLLNSIGPAIAAVTVNTDGAAVAVIASDGAAFLHQWDATEAWTERWDASGGNNSASGAYKNASGTQTAKVEVSSSSTSALVAVSLNADGLVSSIDLTSVNSGSAIKEGDTAIALAGTNMNASGAGARLQITGASSVNQPMTSYSASSATAATANVPTLTVLPFSQTAAGVGLTTWNVEAIGTATINDSSPVPVELRPQTGYDVVEIAVPTLTPDSLLSTLGWTAIPTDLIEWDTSVVASGTTVAVTVNDDGTVNFDSTPNPLPASVSFQFRAYSSADNEWTSYATATFGAGGLMSMAMLRRRRRGG